MENCWGNWLVRLLFSAGSVPQEDIGVGKWSRIATFGTKRQRQLDGSFREIELSEAAFAQALQNFRRMFAGRGKGMGSDYEHQTVNAAENGQPAPNLCYWGAMAVVGQDGAVTGAVDLFGNAPQIDPAAERARLAADHPETDGNPAGLWALCTEVTPLGRKLIPNYSQLSMLFSDDDVDEAGAKVGFCVQNVSFVNVAFLNGTSFHFGKGISAMDMPQEIMAKLAKYGYSQDKPESLEASYHGYMAATDDAKEDRAKVAEAFKKFGKMSAPVSAEPVVDTENDGMAKMNKILTAQIASLSKRVEVAEKAADNVAKQQEEASKATYAKQLAAFKHEMISGPNARYLESQAADLDALVSDVGGDLEKARKHAERIPPIAAFKRMTAGGNPVGVTVLPPPGIAMMSKNQRGIAFNKAVRELMIKEKIGIEAAQQRVAAEQPDLYDV